MQKPRIPLNLLLAGLLKLQSWDSNATTGVLGNGSLSVQSAISRIRTATAEGFRYLGSNGQFFKRAKGD